MTFLSRAIKKRLSNLIEEYWGIKRGEVIQPWMFGKLVLDIQELQAKVNELERRQNDGQDSTARS